MFRMAALSKRFKNFLKNLGNYLKAFVPTCKKLKKQNAGYFAVNELGYFLWFL